MAHFKKTPEYLVYFSGHQSVGFLALFHVWDIMTIDEQFVVDKVNKEKLKNFKRVDIEITTGF